MSIALRNIGIVAIVAGLLMASWAYLGPGLALQARLSDWQSSANKDSYDRSHPGWRAEPGQGSREQLVSVVFGFGLALVGVGLVGVTRRPGAGGSAGAV